MTSEATWHGRRNCRLTLHYENGFTLTTDTDGVVENGGGADTSRGGVAQTILWHYPFEKLQMSSDDGRRLLWLDFGDDGEQVDDDFSLIFYHIFYHFYQKNTSFLSLMTAV